MTVTFTGITTGAVTQNAITIPISYTPTGAVLQWPSTPYTIGVGKGKSTNLRVLNRGNAAGDAVLTLADTANFSLAATAGVSTTTLTGVNAHNFATTPVFNVPASTGASTTATLTSDNATTLCAPLPTASATIAQ